MSTLEKVLLIFSLLLMVSNAVSLRAYFNALINWREHDKRADQWQDKYRDAWDQVEASRREAAKYKNSIEAAAVVAGLMQPSKK